MSEEKKGSEMSVPSVGPEKTVETLGIYLGELADAGDLRGGLELIKFVRRFVPDRPTTDYRTVGFPASIVQFLGRCGMKEKEDFSVTASKLDPESHVISLLPTETTLAVLNRIAGLRVASGPSVCDRLYCELIKDEGRDFMKPLNVGPGAVQIQRTVTGDVLKRTLEIYKKVAGLEGKYLEDPNDARIVAFAKTQFRDGKLVPEAAPVVPLAVAELFWCVMTNDEIHTRLFTQERSAEESVAARPVDVRSGNIPLVYPVSVPINVLRHCSDLFDGGIAKDALSFVGTSGGEDGIFVALNSELRFPAATAEKSADILAKICDELYLFSLISAVYEFCYPGLKAAFDAKSSVRTPCWSEGWAENAYFGGPEMKKFLCEGEADRLANLEKRESCPDDPRLLLLCSIMLAPYTSLQPAKHLFRTCKVVNSIRVEDDASRKSAEVAKTLQTSIARRWFETVHGFKAPDFKPEECREKLTNYLVSKITDADESGCGTDCKIKIEIAAAVRTYTETELGVSDIVNIIDGADVNGLHSRCKFCTQVISTVTGSNKSLESYVKSAEQGANTTAPTLVVGRLSEERDLTTKFIEFADSTDVQFRSPRGSEGFSVYVETNFKDVFHMRDGWFMSGFSRNLGGSLINAITEGTEDAQRRLKERLAPKSVGLEILTKIIGRSSSYEKWVTVGYKLDGYGRVFLVFGIAPVMAFVLMALKASDDDVNGLVRMIEDVDSSIVRIASDNWVKAICEKLLKDSAGNSRFQCYGSIISGFPEVKSLTRALNLYPPNRMFNMSSVTEEYQQVLSPTSSDPSDSN